jgi:hypothetical protein
MKPVYETPPRRGRYLLVSLLLSAAVVISAFSVMRAQAAARQARAAEAKAARAAKAVAQIAKEAPPAAVAAAPELPVQKWEYRLIAAPLRGIAKEINTAGAEGWELVSVTSDGLPVAYFKRPLREAALAPANPLDPESPAAGSGTQGTERR